MTLIPGESLRFIVPHEANGDRLDAFLARVLPAVSRSQLKKSIDAGDVRVNGQLEKASMRLQAGQSIVLTASAPAPSGPLPEPIALNVIFEDDVLIAVNKPAGMVVHPAKGHWQGTMASALAHHCQKLSSVGGESRPGIVHRLDRDTTGVLIAAKNDASHMDLARQFESRSVSKEYLAIVRGWPTRDADVIDCAIGIHPYQREKMAIRNLHGSSRPAVTQYHVLEQFHGFALLHVLPKTGRTHQIRVHLAHAGLPIVADRLYAGHARLGWSDLTDDRKMVGVAPIIARQALHASKLRLHHPVTKAIMAFEAPLPEDMQALLAALRSTR